MYLLRIHAARAAAEKLGYHRPAFFCITSQTRKYFICTSVLNKVFFLSLEEGNTLKKIYFHNLKNFSEWSHLYWIIFAGVGKNSFSCYKALLKQYEIDVWYQEFSYFTHFYNSLTFGDLRRSSFHCCMLLDGNSPWISRLLNSLSTTLHIVQTEAHIAFCYRLSLQECLHREKLTDKEGVSHWGKEQAYLLSSVMNRMSVLEAKNRCAYCPLYKIQVRASILQCNPQHVQVSSGLVMLPFGVGI